MVLLWSTVWDIWWVRVTNGGGGWWFQRFSVCTFVVAGCLLWSLMRRWRGILNKRVLIEVCLSIWILKWVSYTHTSFIYNIFIIYSTPFIFFKCLITSGLAFLFNYLFKKSILINTISDKSTRWGLEKWSWILICGSCAQERKLEGFIWLFPTEAYLEIDGKRLACKSLTYTGRLTNVRIHWRT
jgi:hypothetical protein